MNTIQDFTAKLDKINWTKFDDNKLYSEDGFRLSYSVEIMSHTVLEIPRFQVIIRLRYKDSHVQTWGCETMQCQDHFGLWFIKKESYCNHQEYAQNSKDETIAKAIFDSL